MLKNSFGQGPFLFRLNDSGSGPSLLNQVCLERGWREYCPESDEENWNLWWKTNSFTTSYTKSLSAWQFTNHIPKGSAICRKDNLARYLRCMKSIYGPIYDFSPNGYNLPLEYTKFAAELNRFNFIPYEKSKLLGECGIWICKPVSKSQGRGIFLFRKLSDLNYDTNAIVQRYIEKPLLIGGYKFDLRLYVCVPSYHPLTIYMYKEGLTRFGTDKFNLNDLSNPFRHLTNCSINKLGPNYTKLKDRIGAGCKWTLISLRRYFLETGIHDWLLWQKISNLVVLTILSHATQIPETFNCFDFLGFDILIDENLRPWLLEVNLSPALSNDCEADRLVKKPMLHDMFDLLGLPLLKTGLGSFDLWHESDADSDPDEGIDVESTASTRNHSLGTDSRESLGYIPTRRKNKCSRRVKSKYHSSTKVGFSAAINKTFSRKPLTLAKHTLVLEEQQLNRNEEWKKHRSGKWGNGRDWSHPKQLEGDWVRIWPLKLNTNSVTTFKEPLKEVKNIVQEVSKYSRVSKEMIKKHPRASDKFLNQQLRQELDIAGEIWLPPLRSKT